MFVSHCRQNVPLSLVTICRNVRFAHMSGLKSRKRGVMNNATANVTPLGLPGEASCAAGNFSSVSSHTTPPSSTPGEETMTSAGPAVKTKTSDPARESEMNRQQGSIRLLKKPVPPWKPEPEDCCGSGCKRCIFDMYYEQLEEYEEALKRWDLQQRQLGQTGDDTSSPK
ncbi:oxidoreductase-like, amine-terminal protein [Toxoplasma gondii RUB]|uniref:Oxidoreductase-like domain-containing protein n=11 Tax=Toxoplasma gondii TaxID=5811 RepID=S7WIJ9_TOXGG|nr:hypothetical protein TGGT1_230640 [Toxoplasma gondii GT1]KAF4641691.1 hypothetical protein TGRH88_075010 [Toxoplasma gondii]KFG48320.1 oxidoreductase-like, amine-terminal protein [Toxoplasma gondii GAB2-2007-GAL-DOM2]KFG50884.1 oxidoreductase-like, amine-terminal protein [Toxoplasma gondii p89]KFG55487.1 oxidoreductase-like, amine-terminal protein [Toxoplasma gondii FOU]KFG63617.1 oxidoreductase-like, amine-terminal protein [Toxoplasma gondii RUB]KFH10986.1 oxidoreductase-like, amine-termi